MAFLRTIRNTLFGQNNTTQGETAQMLGSKLAKGGKLTTSSNDLPLENDPLAFTYFTYPNDLNTISNGHYVKFDIYENNLSKLSQAPSPNNPFNFNEMQLGDTTAGDVGRALSRTSKAQEPGKSQNADNAGDGGKKKGGDDPLTADKLLAELGTNNNINTMRKAVKNKSPREINNALDLHSHTHAKQSSASIILYTQSTNTFSTAASYENAETGFLADFLGGGSVFDAISRGGAAAVTKLAGAAVTTALEIVVPGAGGFFNRSTGMSVNPNMELAFKSVPFRSFNFDYKFAPKNKKELDSVHKIIQLFRFHMSPALLGQTQYFAAPSQFMLTYMYRENENNYIPRIAKCVLENIDVDYSPGEKFTTLKPDTTGASPQLINVKMQFKEMSIITKETISEGY